MVSSFNTKAKQWIEGRRHWQKALNDFVNRHGHPHLWIHAASAGEFEQARTVIDVYRLKFPQRKILLTFFSPSGYNLRKNYPKVDGVLYLPADTPGNAEKLINILKPQCVVFVKYEYWFFILKELKGRNIPAILISAVFRPGQAFWQWWGKPLQACLTCFTQIFTQNQASQNILLENDYAHATLSGDTRFDRVAEIATEKKNYAVIDALCAGKKVLVAGSTWPADENFLQKLYTEVLKPKDYILIIAPHEISKAHVSRLQSNFPNAVLYSQIGSNPAGSCLIIDNIGMLGYLYQYATWTYIGGGFGEGIHNILEPAVYGKPVIFGPKYQKFYEAKDLINEKGAFSFNDYHTLLNIFTYLENANNYNAAANTCLNYVRNHTGATGQVVDWLSVLPVRED